MREVLETVQQQQKRQAEITGEIHLKMNFL